MAPRVASLLWFALVLISVLAEPFPIQLDLKREAVSASQLARRASGSVSAPLIQQVLLQQLYWFNFSIGTPPQHFAVQLDTGSSDLWVPAADSKICKNHPVLCAPTGAYRSNESSTYELLIPGEFFEAYKTPSSDKGDFVSDVVQFGGITLPNTTFGVAINQTGSAEASKNGILGMSYTVFQAADTRSYTYPTILDRLYTIGQIQRHAFSLYLNDRLNGAGSILFGGVDSEKYTGDLVALPIIMDDYYGNQTFVEYRVALTSIGINSDAGNYSALTSSNFTGNALLDSGTTNMELPPTVVDAIFKGLGANEISSGGNTAYLVPCSYRNSNLSIAFQFGGASGPFINVTLADLLYEAGGLYSFGNGEEACVIEVVAAAAHNNDGYGYILGDSFLRSAYVVYDQDNNQIAMAQAKPNATASNIQMIPSGTGLPGVSSTATAAAPERTILSGTAGQASASATGVATGGTSSSPPTSSKVPTTLPMSAGSPTIALGVTGSGSAAASSSGSASGAASMHVAPMGSMTAILLVSVAASVLTGMLML